MQTNYATDKDLIERALLLNSNFTKEDYQEVLRCLKIGLKEEVRNGSDTGYKFPHIGVMYIKYDTLVKNFVVKGRKRISNWQIRFEKVLKEVMEKTLYKYSLDIRVRKGAYGYLKKNYDLGIEEIEKIQNEEFYK
jgi:hypothetical protein